ncbi:MAG: hypothetical protein R2745_08610 [Vicinamibacterales bacterium]
MTAFRALRFVLAGTTVLMLAGVGIFAQTQPMLPSAPKKAFGASISPAWDGWYHNEDGSYTFLMGYYSRNTKVEVDVPIGPDNHFEPGEPDRGQPTHFYPGRNFGMFSIKVPKGYPPTERIWWVLTVNGVTQRIPMHLQSDFTITPFEASEESPGGHYNKPAVLRFSENGPAIQGPVASLQNAVSKEAVAGTPMTLDFWVEDDALWSNGSNAPSSREEDLVEMVIGKYRGPGDVTVGNGHHKLTTLKGGKRAEPYAAKGSTTLTFSEPGDYQIHVTANDLSGPGGGATGCCWTTGLVKVAVKAATTK